MSFSKKSELSSIKKNYYQRFCVGENGEDLYVLQHLNGVCILGLMETHPAVVNGVKRVIFDVNGKSRTEDTGSVRGKHKKGCIITHAVTIVGQVESENGVIYNIRSCVAGALIELNERISSDPKLLQSKPRSDGFFAILLPNRRERMTDCVKHLLSEEEYIAEKGKPEPIPTLKSVLDTFNSAGKAATHPNRKEDDENGGGGGGGENNEENNEDGEKKRAAGGDDGGNEGVRAFKKLREFSIARKNFTEENGDFVFGEERFSGDLLTPAKSRRGKGPFYSLRTLCFLMQSGPMSHNDYLTACQNNKIQSVGTDDKSGLCRFLKGENDYTVCLKRSWDPSRVKRQRREGEGEESTNNNNNNNNEDNSSNNENKESKVETSAAADETPAAMTD